MKKIPFSIFQEPELNFFNNSGSIIFKYSAGKIKSGRIEQYVYSYFIIPSSRSGSSWTVQGASVGGFPDVYHKTLGVNNITWKFRRENIEEIDLLMVYINGNGDIARSEFLCGLKTKREEISRAMKPLVSAARKYGIPEDGVRVTHIYNENEATNDNHKEEAKSVSDGERYFRVLGIFPTSNVGLVKAAYRELAKQYHPDTNSGISQDRMKEINEAYEQILSKLEYKKDTH